MKMLLKLWLAVLVLLANNAWAGPPIETLKAYRAYGDGRFYDVQQITTACISRHYTLAIKMERDVSRHPALYSTTKYWALSDVAECLFLRGQSYEKRLMYALARNDFENLIRYFPLARVEDVGGWVWWPAVEAQKELEVLNLHD